MVQKNPHFFISNRLVYSIALDFYFGGAWFKSQLGHCYPDWGSSLFSSVPPSKYWDSTSISDHHFLPNHHSSYHLTVHSKATDNTFTSKKIRLWAKDLETKDVPNRTHKAYTDFLSIKLLYMNDHSMCISASKEKLTHHMWLWGYSLYKILSPGPVFYGTKWLLWRPPKQSSTFNSKCRIDKGLTKKKGREAQ
jgi:hypothetical protein